MSDLGAPISCAPSFSLPTTMSLTGSSAIESHQIHERVPDTASELLIAELVLDDITTVQATRKGKMREDASRSDEDIAFDLQATSLSTLIGILHDYHFASSIDRAIGSDARQLGRLALREQAERDDHQVAVALQDGHELPRQTLSQRIMEQTLAQLARSIRAWFCTATIDHSILREPPPAHHGHTSSTTETGIEAINAGVQNVHLSTPEASKTVPRQSSK